ncbi:MAG: DNA repair protein RecN [Actinomycetota bacterium]
MLRELHISGLGVVEDCDLELHPGLNVLTGETGAGKTMVTVGLALALGQRASASLVREDADAARVQARFESPSELRDDAEGTGWARDGEIVLARSVSADGRSSARIGGQLAPVSALAEVGRGLVEVHGQHQAQRLLSTSAQAAFLDRWAGSEHVATLTELRVEHERLRSAVERLEQLAEMERERERELDLLAHQIGEIESIGPRDGEIEELEVEEARLAHAERLLERAGEAEIALTSDDAALDALARATAALSAAGEIDPEARELGGRATEVTELAAELARDVRVYRERTALDPARLQEVRERIQALRSLSRKYGETEADVLAFLEVARARVEVLAGAGDERRDLELEVLERRASVAALADRVSAARAKAAPGLGAAIRGELVELGMEGALVEIELERLAEIGPGGAERAEVRFAGGPGQSLLPLAKVASGGELSRMMLAFRSVLVDLDDVPTLVFDEVDAGIGGRAGIAVGRRLATLARTRQVLVVTHLPQIASFADRHIRVTKRSGTASVDVLEDTERVAELSRMLAGLPGSGSAAMHAEELLAEAGRTKTQR